MGTFKLVASHFEGTTPADVIQALSSTAQSWEPRDCYFMQALMAGYGLSGNPQPIYACLRALDAAMGELLLEEFPRGFLQFDREGRDFGGNIRWLVAEAIKLVAEFTR
jgi:hypothetical protein